MNGHGRQQAVTDCCVDELVRALLGPYGRLPADQYVYAGPWDYERPLHEDPYAIGYGLEPWTRAASRAAQIDADALLLRTATAYRILDELFGRRPVGASGGASSSGYEPGAAEDRVAHHGDIGERPY